MLMEKLSQGFPIAIIGYCMVFIVLAILWGIIELMHILLTSKKPEKNDVQKTESVSVVEKYEDTDECELVAVLTAAVAASLNTSTYNLKLKSFKRIDTKDNAWSKASRNNAVNKF